MDKTHIIVHLKFNVIKEFIVPGNVKDIQSNFLIVLDNDANRIIIENAILVKEHIMAVQFKKLLRR